VCSFFDDVWKASFSDFIFDFPLWWWHFRRFFSAISFKISADVAFRRLMLMYHFSPHFSKYFDAISRCEFLFSRLSFSFAVWLSHLWWNIVNIICRIFVMMHCLSLRCSHWWWWLRCWIFRWLLDYFSLFSLSISWRFLRRGKWVDAAFFLRPIIFIFMTYMPFRSFFHFMVEIIDYFQLFHWWNIFAAMMISLWCEDFLMLFSFIIYWFLMRQPYAAEV